MRIDIGTAQQMILNYKNNHWNVINNNCSTLVQAKGRQPVQDSRSVWFSFDELQNFIVDAISANPDANGIRFYFGEYGANMGGPVAEMALDIDGTDEDMDLADVNERIGNVAQCAGMHTLVMIPTVFDEAANINCDFNLANPDGGFDNPNDMAAENHGSMAPPPWQVGGAQNVSSYAASCGAVFLDL